MEEQREEKGGRADSWKTGRGRGEVKEGGRGDEGGSKRNEIDNEIENQRVKFEN